MSRWIYRSLPVDGLHRVLWYQPHHATGYALGFSAMLVLVQARVPTTARVFALSGVPARVLPDAQHLLRDHAERGRRASWRLIVLVPRRAWRASVAGGARRGRAAGAGDRRRDVARLRRPQLQRAGARADQSDGGDRAGLGHLPQLRSIAPALDRRRRGRASGSVRRSCSPSRRSSSCRSRSTSSSTCAATSTSTSAGVPGTCSSWRSRC